MASGNPRKRRMREILEVEYQLSGAALSINAENAFNLALYKNGGYDPKFTDGDYVLVDDPKVEEILGDTETALFGGAINHYLIGDGTLITTASIGTGLIYSNNLPMANYVPMYDAEGYTASFVISSSLAISGSGDNTLGILLSSELNTSGTINFYTSSAEVPDFTAASASFTSSNANQAVFFASASLPVHVYFTSSKDPADSSEYFGFWIYWTSVTL